MNSFSKIVSKFESDNCRDQDEWILVKMVTRILDFYAGNFFKNNKFHLEYNFYDSYYIIFFFCKF